MAKRKIPPAPKAKEDLLRARAERLAAKSPAAIKAPLSEDIRKIIHELQVYQIELEMQNDELRKAQVEIEESRSRYVDLYDLSPVGYITLSKTSRVLDANLTAASLLGIPRGSLVGLIFTQFIVPEHRDSFIRYKGEVLRTDGKLAGEFELCKADGTRFWVSLDGLAVRGVEAGPPRILGAFRDITKRRLAQAEIRRLNADLEDRVRLRTAQLQEANRFLRDEGRRLRKAHQELGQKTSELEKLAVSLEERVAERTSELAESNASLKAEIGQRLAAERELMRLAAAADQAAEGIIITDTNGTIHYANPAFGRAVGMPREGLVGRSYCDFLGGVDDDGTITNSLLDVVRLGLSLSSRLARKSPAGRAREIELTFAPIRDNGGEVISYLSIERDVTEQQQLNQYVQRWQKMEALGTLAGGIAHDFNNILTPIIVNTELALMDLPQDSPLRLYLEAPLAAAHRGKGLINQIITFSRQKAPEKQSLKLGPLIKETLELLKASLPKNVEVRRSIRADGDTVLADPAQIQQLLMNLCRNAGYAMREKGGVLEVGLAPVEVDRNQALASPDMSPGPYVRLMVRDTGTGMTPDVLSKAFDPFFTTKRPGEGAGLGLAVVLSIVKSLGGAVLFESEAGKGATFSVFLPRVKGSTARKERAAKTLATGHERVLVVEDEKVQVETLQLALEKLGYRVKGMDNSTEALAIFRTDPSAFDLIITDQTMPEMTGLTLAAEILKTRPDIPIIMCTGFSEVVDPEKARAAGVAKFMMKPFTVREMAAAVREACGKRSGAPRLTRSD